MSHPKSTSFPKQVMNSPKSHPHTSDLSDLPVTKPILISIPNSTFSYMGQFESHMHKPK